jgi:predicted N-acetyltransferase YhbS
MKYNIKLKSGDQVISSLVLYTVSLKSRNLAVIEEVKTHEDFRNKGYARRLIKLAIKKAKELGADYVELCTRHREFYSRCGFKEDGNVRMRLTLNPDHIIKW